MKLRVRDQKEEQEQIVEVWVEDTGAGVAVRVERPGQETGWRLVTFTPAGLRISRGVHPDIGFPLDSEGRIKLIE